MLHGNKSGAAPVDCRWIVGRGTDLSAGLVIVSMPTRFASWDRQTLRSVFSTGWPHSVHCEGRQLGDIGRDSPRAIALKTRALWAVCCYSSHLRCCLAA